MTAHVEHGHIADRPSWDCVACVKPWPCDPAREALATQMDPVQLAMYLWSNLEEAAGDLPDMPVGEAFDRFISWTRSPNRASAP